MRVLKFGGSSLADAERFLRVADIAVNTHGQSQVALVLSAPAKVTNHLVALVEQTSRGMDASNTLFEINGIFWMTRRCRLASPPSWIRWSASCRASACWGSARTTSRPAS